METKMVTRIEAIKEIVKNYQQTADEIIEKYSKELEVAKSRYSEEVYKQKSREIWARHSGKLQAEAAMAVNNSDAAFETLSEQINKWVVAPVSSDVLMLLDSLQNFKLTLTIAELKMLENHFKTSYWGVKLLSGIANESGYFLKVPDVSKMLKEIDGARKNTEIAIRAYSGHEEATGRALLEGGSYLEPDKGRYGANQQYFAANFLKRDGVLDRLEKLLEEFSAPINFSLTEKEKKRIHDIFGDRPDPAVVQKVFADEPELFNKLGYVPAYRDIISQYVSESNE